MGKEEYLHPFVRIGLDCTLTAGDDVVAELSRAICGDQ